MEIIVKGLEIVLPENTVDILEGQLETLKSLLSDNGTEVSHWLEKFDGDDDCVIRAIEKAGLTSLGTEIGLAFLKSKFPCPSSRCPIDAGDLNLSGNGDPKVDSTVDEFMEKMIKDNLTHNQQLEVVDFMGERLLGIDLIRESAEGENA